MDSTSDAGKTPFVPPVALVHTALRLRRFLLRAADAVVPAYVALMDHFMGAASTMMVHSAAKLRVADHLKDGPLDAAELARRTGSDADVLERMMRALVALGVFRRGADGRFANNRVSSGLITGTPANIRGFTEFFGTAPVIQAWMDLPRSLREGGVAFNRVHGKGAWDWMATDDAMRAAFVDGMSSMTELVAPAIAECYPFGEVKTVCDVGGGVGIVLAAVLRKHPHLQGILFDSEAMLGEATAFLEKKGVAAQVQKSPGSFFDTIPRGADAYLLKTVVHNWDDADALKILKNCRAAMDPGQRLLVEDFLDVPDAITMLVPFMDIAGMLMFSGRERSRDAMARLFEQAGFRMGRVVPIPACQAVFEGIAV